MAHVLGAMLPDRQLLLDHLLKHQMDTLDHLEAVQDRAGVNQRAKTGPMSTQTKMMMTRRVMMDRDRVYVAVLAEIVSL